jgi:small GTP-binding protein
MPLDRGSKVVFIGSINVGKTTLMTRVADDRFDPNTEPTTCAAYAQYRPHDDSDMLIQFWDTAGMERYKSINKLYYHDAVAALLVFDLTNRKSFDEVNDWKNGFEKENGVGTAVVILVGNKCDLTARIEVGEEDALNWAQKHGVQYFAVSAQTGEGVSELLDGLVKSLGKRTVMAIPQNAPVPRGRGVAACCGSS